MTERGTGLSICSANPTSVLSGVTVLNTTLLSSRHFALSPERSVVGVITKVRGGECDFSDLAYIGGKGREGKIGTMVVSGCAGGLLQVFDKESKS